MKKVFGLVFLAIFLLTGCGSDTKQDKPAAESVPVEKEEVAAPNKKVATLKLNPAEFRERYNEHMKNDAGIMGANGYFDIGVPEIKSGAEYDSVDYSFNDMNVTMTEIIDKDSGNIISIEVIFPVVDYDAKVVQANAVAMHFIYPTAILVTNPDLTFEEYQKIQTRLGFTGNYGDWGDENINISYNGITYSREVIPKFGIKFTLSAENAG